MAPISRHQPSRHDPLYDTDPETGVSIEVFYADRTLETFGRLPPNGQRLARLPRATQRIGTRWARVSS
jgi:hypothetical protein